MDQTGATRGFTEAVPLSLSSMAHASLSLEDGVLDGVRQILSHTLLSCVNYARLMHPPHQWNFRDLGTSKFAWAPRKGGENPNDLPFSLQRLQFFHQYHRSALIYLKQTISTELTEETETERIQNWTEHVGILGRVTLFYTSKEPLTPAEMEGTDTEDVPPVLLYRVGIEYRSLPPTGNQEAKQAEELSMLSFGGSIDDDVKYGALACLYDETAKYVLEIFSVRGKKYKFDLMDSTLHDGTVPRLPSSREGDPFVKSLCVTVTDHDKEAIGEGKSKDSEGTDKPYAVTRMCLTLEGKPRDLKFARVPDFNFMTREIQSSFIQLNPTSPSMVTALPCGHTLILDPKLAGRIYINGRYVTQWGRDQRIGSTGVALFGMDLHSIPFWHGQIVDYEALKTAYAQLWSDILVDARLLHMNICSRLLYRLMMGYDLANDDDDENEDLADVDVDCLETQVLGVPKYDVVGIAAKALATYFISEFGAAAFPCLDHEVQWAKAALPGRKPVTVPLRLISILRRGGHFDIQRTADDTWFATTRMPNKGREQDTIAAALNLLEESGCDDIVPDQFVVVASPEVSDAVDQKGVCRYNSVQDSYCIQERFITTELDQLASISDDGSDAKQTSAYLLGLYIAQQHPSGCVLAKYVLKNSAS